MVENLILLIWPKSPSALPFTKATLTLHKIKLYNETTSV